MQSEDLPQYSLLQMNVYGVLWGVREEGIQFGYSVLSERKGVWQKVSISHYVGGKCPEWKEISITLGPGEYQYWFNFIYKTTKNS